MSEKLILDDVLTQAKQFHGHLGPYLVVGLRMGQLFCDAFGNDPFSFRIHTSVGLEPPYSCVIDGMQVSTPCTVGNSMIRVEGDFKIAAWVQKDQSRVELCLRNETKQRLDTQATRENEEEMAVEIWHAPAAELFEITRAPE